MGKPKPRWAERNTGAFLGPDMLVPVPMHTLSAEYRDQPAESEDSERVPEPEPPGCLRRVVELLARRLHH